MSLVTFLGAGTATEARPRAQPGNGLDVLNASH